MEDHIISGGDEPYPFGEIKSLGDLLLKKLKEYENDVKFIEGKTGRKITGKDLLDQSVLIAKNLRKNGFKKGDVIGLVSENRLEFITITLGCIYAGAIIAPVNATYKEMELEHAFKLVSPKIVFASNFALKNASNVAGNFEFELINIDDSESFGRFLETCDSDDFLEENIDVENDVCAIMYSSGTTGLPKGVQLTHLNIIDSLGSVTKFQKTAADRTNGLSTFLGISPWFHMLGFMTKLSTICVADVRLVYLVKFEEEPFLKSIQEFSINVLIVVPPILLFLSKSPTCKNYNLSSLGEIFCGGAAASSELETAFKKRFNIRLTQFYGMTEVVGIVIHSRTEKSGSVGEVTGNVSAKIIDQDGRSCAANVIGELCLKSRRVMKGYIGNLKATKELIDESGWLHTGDVGYYDDDKNFFIIERLKDIIKYNAFQVSPTEIEAILQTNPKIKEAAVIGIPDDTRGEIAIALVVKQPNVDLTEKEIVDYVAEKTSRIKHLHGGARIVDSLPKNAIGKIVKKDLKRLI